MELRHLKMIIAVVEEGNLTLASKRLFLSQSALSHQLRELEQELGTSLFLRSRKRMVLTQAGQRVLQAAETVLEELESTRADIHRYLNGDAGLIRLSTECYTCYHWLPSLLKSFGRQYPGVEVRIVAEATHQPKRFLLEGKLDLAILSCRQRQDNTGTLHFTELFSDEMVVVAPAGHRFARQGYVRPEEFADEHLICYTLPIESLDIFQRVLLPAGVTPRKTTQIQLTEAIVEMVKAGLGVTVMATWAIKPYLRSKQLVTVPVAEHALQRTWYAVRSNRIDPPHYMASFITHLARHGLA